MKSVHISAFYKCSNLSTIIIDELTFYKKGFPNDIITNGITFKGLAGIELMALCTNPNKLPSDVLTEDVLHKLITYCNKNHFYENQVYFTNYLHEHYNKSIEDAIKDRLCLDRDDDDSKTSVFGV